MNWDLNAPTLKGETHNNGTAMINAWQIVSLLEEAIKVVQEMDGIQLILVEQFGRSIAVMGITIKSLANLIYAHVQVKNGSHTNSPRHAMNTEPVSEIICYNPRTEADLAGEALCCVQNSGRLGEL